MPCLDVRDEGPLDAALRRCAHPRCEGRTSAPFDERKQEASVQCTEPLSRHSATPLSRKPAFPRRKRPPTPRPPAALHLGLLQRPAARAAPRTAWLPPRDESHA